MIMGGQPYKLASISSLGTLCVTGSTILALFTSFFLRGFRRHSSAIWNEDLLLMLLALSASTAFICAGQYSYSRIVPLVCFLEIPILVNTASNSTRKIRAIIYFVFYLFSVYFMFLWRTHLAHQFLGEYGYTNIKDLTLGLPNPNQTGMYLMTVFFVLCIAVTEQKRIIVKFLFAVNACIMAYLIYCTSSRTAMVVTVMFVLYLVPTIRTRFIKPLIRIAPMIPVIISVLLIVFQDSLSSVIFMGDVIETGRINIFSRALESLNFDTILLGNYREYASHNLHNIFISVLVEYGAITVGLFFAYIWRVIIKAAEGINVRNTSNSLSLVGFSLTLIFSSTEAAFYIGGSLYAGFVFVLYYLSLPVEETGVW